MEFGGNSGSIFVLDKLFKIEDKTIRMYSIYACIFAFLIFTAILLIVLSRVIKDKNDKNIIRLRDILLGQTSWVNEYRELRKKEIDTRLDIPILEEREKEIKKKEIEFEGKEKYLREEQERIESLGRKNLKFLLPEKSRITITKDFIDTMPSYINDIFKCVNDINSCTQLFLSNPVDTIDLTSLKSYFGYIATYISKDRFGGKTTDVRIHFRYYNKSENAYDKLVAIIGENIVTKKMTLIPYDDDTMIKKSYECKRALIKSINTGHDYRGNNYTVWQDYMTYTFYNLKTEDKPYLSFGISVKNEARYKNLFYFLNYFKLEVYLQEDIEQVNEYVNIEKVIYGG